MSEIYIYIYIERERERQRQRKRERHYDLFAVFFIPESPSWLVHQGKKLHKGTVCKFYKKNHKLCWKMSHGFEIFLFWTVNKVIKFKKYYLQPDLETRSIYPKKITLFPEHRVEYMYSKPFKNDIHNKLHINVYN